MESLLVCLVFFPLVGALLNAFVLRSARAGLVCSVATLAVALSAVCAWVLFFHLNGQPVVVNLFPWISLTTAMGMPFEVPFGLSLDNLSIIFLLVITNIGSLIHLYSGEYMHHEDKPYRFFVYLNLFIVSMLLLVLGSNMLVTFIGWEGVGACSYLLIGYWHKENANSLAAIKAFLYNRVGDAGFLIAMFLCYGLFHTLDYSEIMRVLSQAHLSFASENATTLMLIGLSLLLAVAGKSAQIPLFPWLADAMAGPTPVSALIHAATMVTAGIYLMTRTSFLLVQSAPVMHTIAIIGAATAFVAATIGLAQNDIKKVLAYSTCSQLGYMVLACGVGAFSFGVAHVVTHAFFKACLFLGAGSVIHALHHEQDIRKMGGLIKRMPITGATFVLATLAIIGFPGFSGFFTKDAILGAAWEGPFGHPALWAVGFVTAGLTAFYMVRLTWLVFFGASRHEYHHPVRENNLVITLPLMILAGLSVVGGVIALPESLTGHPALIVSYLSPVLDHTQQFLNTAYVHETAVEHVSEAVLLWSAVGLVVCSALLAIVVYRKGPAGGQRLASYFGPLYRLVRDKWRVDELVKAACIRPLSWFARVLYVAVHRHVIEDISNGVPAVLYAATTVASDAQMGLVRNYVKLFFIGFVLFGFLLFF